jgi:hypothetical protein
LPASSAVPGSGAGRAVKTTEVDAAELTRMSSLRKEEGKTSSAFTQGRILRGAETPTHFKIKYCALLGSELKDTNGNSTRFAEENVAAVVSPPTVPSLSSSPPAEESLAILFRLLLDKDRCLLSLRRLASRN